MFGQECDKNHMPLYGITLFIKCDNNNYYNFCGTLIIL